MTNDKYKYRLVKLDDYTYIPQVKFWNIPIWFNLFHRYCTYSDAMYHISSHKIKRQPKPEKEYIYVD